MKNDFVRFVKAGALALFSTALLFTACQVGLGDSVDTEAPEIEIKSPANTSVLSKTFTVSGSCKDDLGISRIAVSVKDVTSKAIIYEDNAVIGEGSKTWSIALNKFDSELYAKNNGWQFADGTYQITVQAFDNGGHHSSEVSFTYDVDNTAPVFALTSPNSTDINDPTNYGTVLSFTGEVADDHAISNMSVFIYRTDGTLITQQPLEFSKVETTGGTSVVAAQYNSGDEVLKNYYSSIYDMGNPGTTQGFYAVLTLTDIAGNVSKSSYIKEDVITALENKLGIDSTQTTGLQTIDIKKIENGTFDMSAYPDVTLAALRSELSDKAVSPYEEAESSARSLTATNSINLAEKKYLAFTLNSNADPTFEIVGYGYNGDGNLEDVSSESKINVKVSAGLNGYYIVPSSLKVNLYSAILNNKVLERTSENPYAVITGNSLTDVNGTVTGTYIYNAQNKTVNEIETNVQTATYTIQLPKMGAKKIFEVEVVGNDAKDQPLKGEVKYSFRVAASGKAPKIIFGTKDSDNHTNYEDLAVYGKTDFKYSGTFETDSAVLIEGDGSTGWSVTATNEADSSKTYYWDGKLTLPETAEITNDETNFIGKTYNWSLDDITVGMPSELATDIQNGARYLFGITITLVNGASTSGIITRSIHVDTEKPVINITSVIPTVINTENASKPKINGKVTVTGQIKETNMDALYYWLELTDVDKLKNELQVKLNENLNRTNRDTNYIELSDIETIPAKIWTNEFYDETLSSLTSDEQESFKKYNPKTTSLSVSLPINASHLVKQIAAMLLKDGYNSGLKLKGVAAENIETAFNAIASELKFCAKAVDKAGNESDILEQSYIFDQTTDRPVISLSNATAGSVNPSSSQNMFGTTSNRNLIGSITDDDGIGTATFKYRKRNSGEYTPGTFTFTPDTTSASVNYQLPSEEGEYEILIEVKDNKDETPYASTSVTYHVAVDAGEPKLEITTPQNADGSQNNTFKVEGKASDGSKVVTVYRYAMEANEKRNETNKEITVNTDGTWEDTINTGLNGDIITYRAIDKYGYISDATIEYSIDSVAPVLSDISIKSGAEIYETNPSYKESSKFKLSSDGKKLELGNSDNSDNKYVTITGNWNDKKLSGGKEVDGSGTEKLQYNTISATADDDAWITVGGTSTTYSAGAIWSFDLPIKEGAMNLYIRATDKSGNKSTVQKIEGLKVDFGKPKVTQTITTDKTNLRQSSDKNTNGYYYVKNGETITIEGTVTDSHGISLIEPKFKFNETEIPNYTEKGITFTADDLSLHPKSAKYKVKIPYSIDDGKWTLDLVATDVSGRVSTSFDTVGFVVDTVAPLWKNETVGGITYPQIAGQAAPVGETKKWYNSSSLKFTGYYTENGSGIDEVKYVITPAGSTPLPESSFNTTKATDYETFSATLDGFEASTSENRVSLKAVDKAGNESISQVYSIYIDSESPNLESNVSGTRLSNKTTDITVNGTATDDASGIDSVKLDVSEAGSSTILGSVTATVDTTSTGLSATKATWSATIPASGLLEKLTDGKSYSVKATVTDVAGNKTSSTVFKISVDTTAPDVTINAPLTAASLNGKLAVTGTVNEINEVSSFELYYTLASPTTNKFEVGTMSEDAATKWVKLQHHAPGDSEDGFTITKASDITNFSYSGEYSFDFTNLSKAKEDEPTESNAGGSDKVYILPVVKDSAGNCNIYTTTAGGTETYNLTGKYSEFDVDLNSDRPTVKVTNLIESNGAYFLKYGTNAQISGSITDDDSTSDKVVKKFVASGTQIIIDPNTGKIRESYTPSGKTDFTATTGEWTFTPADKEDGTKEVYFYIEDNAGGVFYTGFDGTGKTLYQPYFQYKTSEPENNSSKLIYKSDSKSPVVENTLANDFGKNFDGTDATTPGNALMTSYVVGGTLKKEIQFVITATDASGIAGIAADLYYTTGSGNSLETHYVANKATDFQGADGKPWQSGKKYIGGVELVESAEYSVTDNKTFKYVRDSSETTYKQTTAGNDTSWTWTTGKIDISNVPTGSITLNVTPYDKAGLTGNQSYTFSVDNTPPTIKVTTPAKNEQVTGVISISGQATDNGSSGTYNIQWIVPTTAQVTAAAADSDKRTYLKGLKWNGGQTSLNRDSTVSAWQFDFDGNYDAATSTPSSFEFKSGNPKLEVYDNSTYAASITNGVYKLPIYFMATDNLGNFSIEEGYSLNQNPDGDKPKLEFTYPSASDYDVINNIRQDYITLGGTIRTTGSAVIPSGTTTVRAVYIQIAASSSDFGSTDKTKASSPVDIKTKSDTKADGNSYNYKENAGGYGLAVVTAYQALKDVLELDSEPTVADDTAAQKYGFATKSEMDNWWGVKANGTASWNISLNSNDGMNPSGRENAGTNNVKIRACGVNAEGKFGAWTSDSNIISIHIDDAAPTITSAVNQYDTALTSSNIVVKDAEDKNKAVDPSVSQRYDSDMNLRSQWYLVLDILDESGISSLNVKDSNGDLTQETGYFVASINADVTELKKITDSSTNKKGRKVFIPISQENTTAVYTVTAVDTDGTSHTASQEFRFNIDNTPPTLDELKGNGQSLTAQTVPSIENNNYVFNISGKSMDEGSGVERIVFYYMRKSGETKSLISNEVVLDPMITTGTDDSKVALSDLTKLDIKQGANTYSLYAKDYSGSATTESFTSGTAYDSHVRVGGLIFIDGAYRKITVKSGNTVDFTPSLTAAKTSVTASFPIAQVIDNSATEKTLSDSANPFTFERGDDGDLMPESFSKSGKTWTWDASIHSDNMPDGPVSLVILAFDAAGNVNGKTVNTKITNNAPRIAKIFFGTDLSGDGKYANTDSLEEIVTYNILAAEGKEQSAYTLDFTEKNDKNQAKYPAGVFKIKNGLAVIPEFTGGNGEIGMILDTSATTTNAKTGTVTAPIETGSIPNDTDGNSIANKRKFAGTAEGSVNGEFEVSDTGNKMYAYNIAKASLGSDAVTKGMSFTFWDSTEETTRGTDSQYSVLYVKNFNVAQNDTVAPTVVINPLYWNSVKDNSIYDSSAAKKVSDLKGHIELEKDWIATDSTGKKLTGYDGKTSGTYLDSDPKVSGKVRFTGTAYDNVRLKSIAITFSNISGTAVATYNKTTSSWTVPATTLASEGYKFSVSDATVDSRGNSVVYGNYEDDVYFGQQGHKIYWTLDIDTAKITDVAAKDISLIVKATDDSNKTTADSTASNLTSDKTARIDVVDGTTNVSSYRVDVVPYITGVITSLSSKSKKVSSVYDRSALGHYPVRSDETVTLKGFNLSTTTISASTLTSGEYNQTVNGVQTLNNINYNNSVGQSGKAYTDDDYAYCYNRQPNGLTNEELTDNIYFDVWEFKTAATTKNGKLKEPVMKINPSNNMIGFAFANGSDSLSLPQGNSTTKNSYTIWQKNYADYAGVNFVYDANGYAHSVSIGLDTEPNSGYAGRMQYIYSPWGGNGEDNMYNWNKQYTVALESVGIPSGTTVNGSTLSANLIDIERFGRPAIGVSKVTTTRTSPTVYMAYYDSDNNQIRFRYGTITQTNNRGSSYPTFDQINDSKNAKNGTIGNSTGSDYGKHAMFEAHSDYYSLLAGGNTGNATGEFVALDVVSGSTVDNDVVVIVWYDGSDLKYTYRSGKKGDLDCNSNGVAAVTTGNNQHGAWAKPETIFSGAGQYCAIKVDDLGGIHIAAYERAGADLYYAYMSSYSNYANLKTALVDSYSQVGKNISIDTAKVLRAGTTNQYNVVPYITYYADGYDGLPKYAYLPDGINRDSPVVPDGANDATDEFTSKWEVEVIPTISVVNEDNMNVAIWKDNNGIMTASTKPSGYTDPSITAAGTNSAIWYGNGTSKFVLGYGITKGLTGFIETAQMK